MQVFITGGTGLIGTAVVAELLGHGHTVPALARSDASARAAEAAGAAVLRGASPTSDVLRAGSRAGRRRDPPRLRNDFSSPAALDARVAEETAALTTLGEALVGSDQPARHRVRHAVGARPRLHRGRPAAHRRPGRRPRPHGDRDPGARPARRAERRRAPAAHGPQRRRRRVRRPADPDRPPDRGLRLPRRRQPALAGRARARRRGAVPARTGVRTGRAARGTPSPTRATPCATSPRSSGAGSAYRSSRCPPETFGPIGADLRDGPAVLQHRDPARARLGADAPEVCLRTWRTSSPEALQLTASSRHSAFDAATPVA